MLSQPTLNHYQPADRAACLALFDENCPAFFAPNERSDYETFLAENAASYEVCLLDGRLVGAYGVILEKPVGLSLRWILLSPRVQRQGLGSAIMTRVLEIVRTYGGGPLHIAASHKSAPFFARFGAQETATTPNGWGRDMHRVDMELVL